MFVGIGMSLVSGRATSLLALYAVLGIRPKLVFDFANEVYRTNGSADTFSGAITYTGNSRKTMVDSDGVLKWAPHNLLLRSEEFNETAWTKANATVTANAAVAPDGTTTADKIEMSANGGTDGVYQTSNGNSANTPYTWSFWAKADVATSIKARTYSAGSASTFNLTTEWQLFEHTETAASTTLYPLVQGVDADDVFYIWGAHLYRSDLGGMVDVPLDNRSFPAATTYVPTTSVARYLPRRGHHVYNGSAWVNEGLLVESEQRTNLITYSQNFADAYWLKARTATLAIDATGPDGETSAVTLVDDSSGNPANTVVIYNGFTVATSTTYTFSMFAKADQLSWVYFELNAFTTPANGLVFFDLATGNVGTDTTSGTTVTTQNFGNGWYRCAITFTTDASDTVGTIYIGCAAADNVKNVDLDGTSSILIYGAQFEIGNAGAAAPTPSSYMPTSGAQFTRAAETLTVAAADLPYPTPRVIGPEQTPAFSTWAVVLTGTWAASGGAYTFTDTVGGQTRPGVFWNQAILTAGKVYQAVIDVASITGATQLRIDSIGLSDVLVGTGQTSFVFVAGATAAFSGPRIRIEDTSTTINDGFALNSFSVREIDPLSVSIQMQGRMTYADTGVAVEAIFHRWLLDGNNQIQARLNTSAGDGQVQFYSIAGGVVDSVDSDPDSYSPDVNVPYNIASRHGSTFVNGAVDGTALTVNPTPTALPALSASNLNLAYDYMGTIRLYRMWDQDLADAGIAAASITKPAIFGLPTISGEITDPEQGETLVAVSAPVVIGTPTPTTTWQWLRDGAPISGATSSSYVLTGDDVGSKISVRQTETNGGGSASATSAETATVGAIPAGAIQERDNDYIFDRAGGYIEVRA